MRKYLGARGLLEGILQRRENAMPGTQRWAWTPRLDPRPRPHGRRPVETRTHPRLAGPTTCARGCCNGSPCVALSSESNSSCGTGGAGVRRRAPRPIRAIRRPESASLRHCLLPERLLQRQSTCEPYASESNSSCGTAGASCAACASGQECDTMKRAVCVRRDLVRANGCCNGAAVRAALLWSPPRCAGPGGAACASCASSLCDIVSGTCSCDSTTCSNGCCKGGTSGTCEGYAAESDGCLRHRRRRAARRCPASGQECDKTTGQSASADADLVPGRLLQGRRVRALPPHSPRSSAGRPARAAVVARAAVATPARVELARCGGGTCAGCCTGSVCRSALRASRTRRNAAPGVRVARRARRGSGATRRWDPVRVRLHFLAPRAAATETPASFTPPSRGPRAAPGARVARGARRARIAT